MLTVGLLAGAFMVMIFALPIAGEAYGTYKVNRAIARVEAEYGEPLHKEGS